MQTKPLNTRQKLDNYLKSSNITNNRFYGLCVELRNGKKQFENIISKDEGNLLFEENGDRYTIPFHENTIDYIEGRFYEFSIFIPPYAKDDQIVLNVDFRFNPPVEVDHNPYQEFVRLRYERLDNPEANKMIANLMREIGKGLYSSKQRMIFELLQNADDTPIGNDVSFHIDTYGDYLLIMHNGVPFNRDDVEAITSAAESTKRNDRRKTGYKGIGFKSVFTDSEEVIIKSGGYLFSFRRDHPGFHDFDTFYFDKKRYVEYPKLLVEDRTKFARQIRSFNGQIDIPWQLVPIWMNQLPEALTETSLGTYNNNVGFAIKMGSELLGQYIQAIESFSKHPVFMLFLRNITVFKSEKNNISVRKSETDKIKIRKDPIDPSKANSEGKTIWYIKKTVDNIQINDAALAQEGVNIFKRQKENGYGEITYYFSRDIDGRVPIESIPPKLAAFDETSITLAVPVLGNQIQAVQEYLEGKSYSSLFTYLPMREHRIKLPFLANADFVPSSDREDLQGDDLWNEYIIAKIATHHVLWLRDLAIESAAEGVNQKEYLSLILKNPLPEDDTIQLLINKYNQNYNTALFKTPIVISEDDMVRRLDETILDDTKINTILGHALLYQISDTDKFFPHPKLNTEFLDYPYLNVERYTNGHLLQDLDTEEGQVAFADRVGKLDPNSYRSFLAWLNKFIIEAKVSSNWLMALPFVQAGERGVVSIQAILEESDLLIKTERLKTAEPLLNRMGFTLTVFQIDRFANIFQLACEAESYLNDDALLYDKIREDADFSTLSPLEKNQLLTFVDSFKDERQVGFARSLAIFNSYAASGPPRPLSQLIANLDQDVPAWLKSSCISPREEWHIEKRFASLLIKEEDFLEKIYCDKANFEAVADHVQEAQLSQFYASLITLKKNLPEGKQLDYIKSPWLYAPAEAAFAMPADIFAPGSIQKTKSPATYDSLRSAIETLTDFRLPHFSALPFIKEFSLNCASSSIVSHLQEQSDDKTDIAAIGLEQINDLLDWVEVEKESDFLENVLITQPSDGRYSVQPLATKYYHSKDEMLKALLDASSDANCPKPFPPELYTATRINIGLLEGDALLIYLLENEVEVEPLAPYVQKSKDQEVKRLFLSRLDSVDLLSDMVYDKTTNEHRIFDLLIELGQDDGSLYDAFIPKITIDGKSINDKNISDTIIFKPTGEPKGPPTKLKLSEVLSDYEDETAALTQVVENLVDIKKRNILKEKVFKVDDKPHQEIFDEIHASDKEYLSPHQLLFLLLYKERNPELKKFRRGKINFDEYFLGADPKTYSEKCTQMLDLCFEHRFSHFTENFNFSGIDFEELVVGTQYQHKTEMLPGWMQQWLSGDEAERKLSFLTSVGVNGPESAVVSLRVGLSTGENDSVMTGLGSLDSPFLWMNTLLWMQEQKPQWSKDILRLLYQKGFKSGQPEVSTIPIPVATLPDGNSYQLMAYDSSMEYCYYDGNWDPYAKDIFSTLSSQGIHIVDDLLSEHYRKALKVEGEGPEEALDTELLKEKSYPFDEDYYTDLKSKLALPDIQIYGGNALPYKVTFRDHVVHSISKGTVEKHEDVVYIVKKEVDSLPESISNYLNEVQLAELRYLKLIKSVESKREPKSKNGSIRDILTDDECAEVELLLKMPLTEDEMTNVWIVALFRALQYYEANGYDTAYVRSDFEEAIKKKKLMNLVGGDGAIDVYVRSAKQGILFLRYHVWHNLDKPDKELFVTTGDEPGQHELFLSKLELAEYNSDTWVFKLNTNNKLEDITSLFTGEFANDPDRIFNNLWIFIRTDTDSKHGSSLDRIFALEAINHNSEDDWQ